MMNLVVVFSIIYLESNTADGKPTFSDSGPVHIVADRICTVVVKQGGSFS